MDLLNSLVSVLTISVVIGIPILIIWILTHYPKKEVKLSQYLNYSVILIVIGLIVLTFTGVFYLDNISDKYSSNVVKNNDSGFTIEEYNVKLKVNESLEVDVTEVLTVNFYEDFHHGIYRIIPNWLEYTPKDNNTVSRKSNVKKLKAINEKYELDEVNGKERIKIGDGNKTLPLGNKTYTITYQYDMGKDPYEGFDEFIFHAFGDYWNTPINNASLEIIMPKNFDENNIRFFNDKYRSNDITSFVDYSVSDNIIYAKVSPYFDLENSLTIDIDLPDRYFENESDNYGYASMIMCFMIIAFLVIILLKWLKYGKDNKIIKDDLEFYPPEGFDCATIGYIYKKEIGKKLIVSLLIELASKGFIKIDDSNDKKSKIITNLCAINLDKEIKRKLTVIKIKEARSKADIALMSELFNDGKTKITIKENFNDFYSKYNNLLLKGSIEVESDTINDYSKEELDNIQNRLTEKAFEGKKEMTSNEKIVFDQLFEDGDVNDLSKDKKFYKVFEAIRKNLSNELDEKINDLESYKNMAITSTLFFVGSLYFVASFSIIEDLNPLYKQLYLLAIISLGLSLVLIILMGRKNRYGEELYSRIDAFKRYIEIAQKDKIDSLMKESKNYYYEILPYAYVLGVSKKWISKFDNIPDSIYDMGNFNYSDMDSYIILSSSVNQTSSGSSSSGGCSSCGGGCSSCGGGGSW